MRNCNLLKHKVTAPIIYYTRNNCVEVVEANTLLRKIKPVTYDLR